MGTNRQGGQPSTAAGAAVIAPSTGPGRGPGAAPRRARPGTRRAARRRHGEGADELNEECAAPRARPAHRRRARGGHRRHKRGRRAAHPPRSSRPAREPDGQACSPSSPSSTVRNRRLQTTSCSTATSRQAPRQGPRAVQVLRRLVGQTTDLAEPAPPLSVNTVLAAAEPEAEADGDAPVPLAVLVDELPGNDDPDPRRPAPEPVPRAPGQPPWPGAGTRTAHPRPPHRPTARPRWPTPEQASAPSAAPSGPAP